MFLNEYRLAGDSLHGFAILFLIFYIIKKRSCHSVSGMTAILYVVTFSCRYLDLFTLYAYTPEVLSVYNSTFKIYYLFSSSLIVYLIFGLFRKTRDKSHDTFPIFVLLVCAHIFTWFTCYLSKHMEIDKEFFWRFSVFLEMLAIIPQLYLIYKQGTIDRVMTYYLIMLGSYRALYIINWICRYQTDNFFEPIGFFAGCIQTIIYLRFFVHIYPHLNRGNQNQIFDHTKPLIDVVHFKENINQKTKDDIPLIHNVV